MNKNKYYRLHQVKELGELMKKKLDMDAIVEEAVEKALLKQRQHTYNKKPYMDLSARRKRQKNHGGQFREVYKLLKNELHSKDESVKGLAGLKLYYVLKEIAGRPLTENEMKQVISYCEAGHRNKRWSINAFGQMYATKEITSDDIETK